MRYLIPCFAALLVTATATAEPRKMSDADIAGCKAQYPIGSAADYRGRAHRLRQHATHFRNLHAKNKSRAKGTPATRIEPQYLKSIKRDIEANEAETKRLYKVFNIFPPAGSEYHKVYYRRGDKFHSRLYVDADIAVGGPLPTHSYDRIAPVLDISANAWATFHPPLVQAVQNVRTKCVELTARHNEWEANKGAAAAKAAEEKAAKEAAKQAALAKKATEEKAAKEAQAKKATEEKAAKEVRAKKATEEKAAKEAQATRTQGAAKAAAKTNDQRLREAAKRQHEIDQRKAAAATAQRQRNEAKLQQMQRNRDAAINQGAANIANAAAALNPKGQTMLLGMGVAAVFTAAMVGSYNENVEWQHDSAVFVASMSAMFSVFGSGAIAEKSSSRDSTSKQILLGRAPWYGAPLTVQIGAGLAMPTVTQDQWYAVQPLEGGRYPGFIGQATVRVALARITLQGSRHSGTFAPVTGGEDRKSVGWGLGAGIGIQPFSGGLLSPWAELRFGAYPNCEDEGKLVNTSVRDCAAPDTFRLGEGGGAFKSHLVVGNTFSFRNLFAHAAKPGMLRSLFVEVAYQFEGPTGSGPSVIAGFDICGGCQ